MTFAVIVTLRDSPGARASLLSSGVPSFQISKCPMCLQDIIITKEDLKMLQREDEAIILCLECVQEHAPNKTITEFTGELDGNILGKTQEELEALKQIPIREF